jgi:hypothetical protein
MTTAPSQPFGPPVVQRVSAEVFTYDHLPVLRELLPQFRGIPGYDYLMVEINNCERAEAEGWLEVANSITFGIEGPKGRCSVRLYCWGERVPGLDYKSSKRNLGVDKKILEVTGHRNEGAAAEAAVETPAPPEVESTEWRALCGATGSTGKIGKDAHERRCGKCETWRQEHSEEVPDGSVP